MENETLKIGQKYIFKHTITTKQPSGAMATIPAGSTGYVAGNGYIIVTEGASAGAWVPVDRKMYQIDGIDYDGISEVIVTGLLKEGYELDRKANMMVADFLRAIAIR